MKLVKFYSKGIPIDISFNQVGGLCTLQYLEKFDQILSNDHLFKKSVLIIKAWCIYEGRILGSSIGCIATYTLEVMIIHVIMKYHTECDTPIDVYFKFFEVYGNLDWNQYSVTMFGLIRTSDIAGAYTVNDAVCDQVFDENGKYRCQFYKPIYEALCEVQIDLKTMSEKYNYKPVKAMTTPLDYHLNIIDPLLLSNNLGRSVSNFNSKRIKRIISQQFLKYQPLLANRQANLIKYKQEMLKLFDKIYTVMGVQTCDATTQLEPASKLYSSQVGYDANAMYNNYGNLSGQYFENIAMYNQPYAINGKPNLQIPQDMSTFGTSATVINAQNLSDSTYDDDLLLGASLDLTFEETKTEELISEPQKIKDRKSSFTSTCKSTQLSHQENIPNLAF